MKQWAGTTWCPVFILPSFAGQQNPVGGIGTKAHFKVSLHLSSLQKLSSTFVLGAISSSFPCLAFFTASQSTSFISLAAASFALPMGPVLSSLCSSLSPLVVFCL